MDTQFTETDFTFWRSALAGVGVAVHENDPQPGYYRVRHSRGGPWLPVAIWRDSQGSLKALRDGAPADAQDLWTWCCRYPIPYETYLAVAEQGKEWPDQVPSIGHNSSGASPALSLLDEIRRLMDLALGWLEVTGAISAKEEADKAANFAERFAGLEKRAEEGRTAEKRPILEAGRAIDAAWRPIVEAAADGKVRMKKAVEGFLLTERQRQISESSGSALPAGPMVGTSGRRIGLRTVRRVEVTDADALRKAYRRDGRLWVHQGVQTALLELAQGDLMAGRKVAGAILIEDQVAA